jgi:hypothetical protein
MQDRNGKIILDYEYVDLYDRLRVSRDLSSVVGWPALLEDTWFLAGQVFVVDYTDFTCDYPLLGFARHLKAVAFNLSQGHAQGYYYIGGAWQANTALEFFRDGDEVVVRSMYIFPTSERKIRRSARASLKELVEKSESYLERVFKKCCYLVPQLKTQKNFDLWLSDMTNVEPCEPHDLD